MQLSTLFPTAYLGIALHIVLIPAAPASTDDKCPANASTFTTPHDRNSHILTCEQICQQDQPGHEDPNMCRLSVDDNPCQPNHNNFIVWDYQCKPLAQKSVTSDDAAVFIGGLPSLDVHLESKTFDYGARLVGVSYEHDTPNSGVSGVARNMCNGGTSYALKFDCRNYK